VGDALQHRRFPECQLPAVLWPERFRGGCAFGAGLDNPVSSAGISGQIRHKETGVQVNAAIGQPGSGVASAATSAGGCRRTPEPDLDFEFLTG
jgi:hypothetical protein